MDDAKIRERVEKIFKAIERNLDEIAKIKKENADVFERVEIAERVILSLLDEFCEIRSTFCRHDKVEPGGKCSVCGLQIG